MTSASHARMGSPGDEDSAAPGGAGAEFTPAGAGAGPIALPAAFPWWYWATLGGLIAATVGLLWVDGAAAVWFRGVREGTGPVSLGGDVRRELEAIQQFGQLGFSLLIAWAIVLLDRDRCRRLLDWLGASLLAGAVLYPAKMLIARPRPKFDDPWGFAGPFGAYPVEGGVLPGWALGQGSVNDIWAMPSGHTVHAVVGGVFLLAVYPKLRSLAVTLIGIVMLARLVLGAHYPSDVTAGAALGFAVAVPVVRRFGGVRGLDWVWRRVVQRDAEPAFPELARKFGLGGAR